MPVTSVLSLYFGLYLRSCYVHVGAPLRVLPYLVIRNRPVLRILSKQRKSGLRWIHTGSNLLAFRGQHSFNAIKALQNLAAQSVKTFENRKL